jgi:hypothetical protein
METKLRPETRKTDEIHSPIRSNDERRRCGMMTKTN